MPIIQNEILAELLLIEYQDIMLFYQQQRSFINEMLGAVLFGMLVCLGVNVARGALMQPPEIIGAKLTRSIEEYAQKLRQAGARGTEYSGDLCESVRSLFTKQMFERFVGGSNVVWAP